jgi:hypothetical protein
MEVTFMAGIFQISRFNGEIKLNAVRYIYYVAILLKIYRNIILSVVLCGCETWSLTLRGERRLRVFENRVLRRVFGPIRDELTG